MRKILLLALVAMMAIGATAQNMITVVPEGTHKVYNRTGKFINSDTGEPHVFKNTTLEVVTTASNEVYLKDPIAEIAIGTWVKGTKEGNTITIPIGQTVFFLPDLGETGTTLLNVDVYEFKGDDYVKSTDKSFTYTIDGDNIKLNLSDDGSKILGQTVVFGGGEIWSGSGEYGITLTLVTEKPVAMPANAKVFDYAMTASAPNANSKTGKNEFDGTVKVGRVGSDVYFQGLLDMDECANAVVKGAIDKDGVVTFPKGQYIGVAANLKLFLGGASKEMAKINDITDLADVVFVYDSADDKYTLKPATSVVFNNDNAAPAVVEFYTACELKGTGAFTAGISAVDSNEEAVEVVYFDVTGKRVAQPTTGVNIKVVKMLDGTVKTSKVVVR